MKQQLESLNTVQQSAGRKIGALWVSAIALFALLLLVAGRAPFGADSALAISNDRAGDMTVLTVGDGNQHDVVLVVDRTKGIALVYSMRNRLALELHQAEPIERLFSQARAHASSQRSLP